MKKLRKILYGACALMIASMGMTTPLTAGSSEFAGPYVALQGSVNGLVLHGKSTDTNDDVTSATAGKIFGVIGIEAGFSIPVTDNFLFGIGALYHPGSAKFSADAGDNSGLNSEHEAVVTVEDHFSVFIQPTVTVSESSAVYLKLGYVQAGLSISGDVTDPPGSMTGGKLGIGSRTLYSSGMFIQTEAGINAYDRLSMDGGGNSMNGVLTATPTIAYGSVSIGVRF